MKVETHQRDIDRFNEMNKLLDAYEDAQRALDARIDRVVSGTTPADDLPVDKLSEVVRIGRQKTEAEAKWRALPKDRREAVVASKRVARRTAHLIDRLLPTPSGESTCSAHLGTYLSVTTETSKGETYSKRCTWRKTNVSLSVTLTAECALSLQKYAWLADMSAQDGLPLLCVKETPAPDVFECYWAAKSRGHSIRKVQGWVAIHGDFLYHSEKSRDHALRGLAKKLASVGAGASLKHLDNITRRHVRDATGWCGPGVQAWIEKYMPAHARKRSVPREVVLQAAQQDPTSYGKQLVSLLSE